MKRLLAGLLAVVILITVAPFAFAIGEPAYSFVGGEIGNDVLTISVDISNVNALVGFFAIKYDNALFNLVDESGADLTNEGLTASLTQAATDLGAATEIQVGSVGLSSSTGYDELAVSWLKIGGVNAVGTTQNIFNLHLKLIGNQSSINESSIVIGTDSALWDVQGMADYGPLTFVNSSGQTLKIPTVVYSFDYAIPKLDQDPVTLALSAKGTDYITVSASGGSGLGAYEYAYNTTDSQEGVTWGSSGAFTGLTPDTTYYFYAKRLGDDTYNESVVANVSAKTDKLMLNQDAVTLAVSAKGTDYITVSAGGGSGLGAYEYAMNAIDSQEGLVWVTSGAFTGLTANTTYYFYAKKLGDADYNESAVVMISATTDPEAPSTIALSGTITPSVAGATKDITITFTDTTTSAVYSVVATKANEYAFSLDLPAAAATYDVSIGRGGYLARTISGYQVAGTGDISGFNYALYAGDVNGDKFITLPDITAIIARYNGDAAGRNEDVNDDGFITLPDITTVIANYNRAY